MGFVVAIFGQASGVAFYPYLSRLAIEQKFGEITALLNKALTAIAVYCVPLSLLLLVCAPQVISILYEHGSFSAASTAKTAPVFALYMAGAFVFSAAVFAVRPFYAVQKMYIPVVVSSAVSVVCLPLYYLTGRWWGAPGIAASAVTGMALQFFLLYFIWNSRYGDRASAVRILRTGAVILCISAAAAAAGWAVNHSLVNYHSGFGKLIDNLLICAGTFIPSGIIVVVLYQVTGVARIRDLIKRKL
jgi:putative peptidoglycan lipid II flippase